MASLYTSVRAVVAEWRRDPFVGAVGVVSVLGALAMGPYLWVRKLRHVAAEPGEFIWDFSYFYRAAERFAADPLTLYADPEYFYPPLSVLAFLPWLVFPEAVAYHLAVLADFVLMGVCGVLAVRLWERHAGTVTLGARWAAVLFVLASAPTFQTLKYGQVGPLVLLSGLVALWWVGQKPVGAALALAAGFWLKLYPLALAPLGLMRAGRVRFAAALAAGLVLVPLLFLPLAPPSIYAEYVGERTERIGGTTWTYALNQSFPSALERALRPAEAALNNRSPATVRPGVQRATAALGVLLLGAVFWAALRGAIGTPLAGFFVLALLPFLSNFGWEHSYVLALPLVQAAFLEASRGRGRLVAGLAVVCFLFPMLPRVVLEAFVGAGWRPWQDLWFVRFPIVASLAAGLLVVTERRRATQNAPTA